MGLEALKKKVEEAKERIELTKKALDIADILSESVPELLDEQKRMNELLEKILNVLESIESKIECNKNK